MANEVEVMSIGEVASGEEVPEEDDEMEELGIGGRYEEREGEREEHERLRYHVGVGVGEEGPGDAQGVRAGVQEYGQRSGGEERNQGGGTLCGALRQEHRTSNKSTVQERREDNVDQTTEQSTEEMTELMRESLQKRDSREHTTTDHTRPHETTPNPTRRQSNDSRHTCRSSVGAPLMVRTYSLVTIFLSCLGNTQSCRVASHVPCGATFQKMCCPGLRSAVTPAMR